MVLGGIGRRRRIRPPDNWMDGVRENMELRGLHDDEVMNRKKWKLMKIGICSVTFFKIIIMYFCIV